MVDSHCHLDFPELAQDLDGVIGRAAEAGVHLMVTISTRVRRFEEILKIAERYEQVYCTVGTHPHNAAEEPDVTADELVAFTSHPKVVGIGEAGLDYHYDNSPRDAQAAGFRVHIEASRRTGLPLVIHSRSAEDDTASILEEEMKQGAFKPLLHCFSSNIELAKRGLAIGAYVSLSGILTFKSAEEIRQSAAMAPMDRLLVETDAPYLAPVPHRGKSNEPAFTRHTLECLAEVKGVSPDEMARATSDNFFTLFSKVPRPEIFQRGRAA
ncbi:MAG: TatD family hydrolase [Rhizobiales bacterium]|nr:TatD family hydrolase [Hyphomicrobiales bacterium]